MPARIDTGRVGRVAVVGAGVVGLSTAWFLQEHGIDVVVVDRDGVAAGASWGNAGYLAPGKAVPLPEPGLVRYGLKSMVDRDAPLYVPASADPRLLLFLAKFARHCTTRSWRRSMRSYVALNEASLAAFDALHEAGVEAEGVSAPLTAAFENEQEAASLRGEYERMAEQGQHVHVEEGPAATAGVPQLSSRVQHVMRIHGQRFVDPGEFVKALATSVQKRGGQVRTGFDVSGIERSGEQFSVGSTNGERELVESVVIASGAWFGRLAKPFGIRMPVQAGRGYSFTVPTEQPVPGPIYLPAAKVACTPYQGGLRVGGTMEFRPPDAPLDTHRIEAIVRSARPLLQGVAWDQRQDDWVGSRPVSADGLPLIGESKVPGVFVAGGHGMWGLTQGPATGRLLAEQIVTGTKPATLAPFNPLR